MKAFPAFTAQRSGNLSVVSIIVQRIATGLLTLWVVSLLIFASTEILPGDVASAILGQHRTPEAELALRHELGLDRPAPVRYVEWLSRFVQGDIGRSLINKRDMGPEIRERFGNTMFLAGIAACIAVPLSILFGLIAAVRQNGLFDRVISMFTLFTVSVPEFFVGYVLIIVFAVKLGLVPSLSMVDSDMALGARLQAVTLPVATLVLVVLAHMMRQTRAAVIGVLSSPFIEMAILKGIPWWRIVLEHALPNALAPIINVVAIALAWLIVGVVVVDIVFVYPGMGQLMVDAVSNRDIPVVQTCGLIFASVYVGFNMIADMLAVISNPRLRHPR
ncbi:ABC transporter permease [Mesorhizobium sp. WSM4307]|uniref:ABC transporter permease n=1 Tax=unclassified Mesorhizobium TaxID=325217 RepID=UPI000BAEA88F|nr:MULTISPECIES: ABC transporter permease [unclassified Mesorhizobium]PBB22746.1 ABC transporter permease [Mesorhizobium sp. WSM4304]PBB71223.1 ABC transporter permease [Mesorhizobium sp. WSM4308]TRC73057.1 ABC transporter permease [Mesorhizobium sp. WSM4315]TRC83344.1 ABC transporter permease [Mesorhizobium sp. WSM4307]